MLTRMLNTLRRHGVLPVPKREVLVVLNHNPADPKEPGDVSIFGSAEALVGDLRAVDVLSNEYFAIDTTGRLIEMSPRSTDPTDLITVSVATQASHAQLAQRMLKHFLLAQFDEETPDQDRARIEREYNMAKLIEMVPINDVFGYVDGISWLKR